MNNNELIGIIVEFNPFHNGHKNLIKRIKSDYPNSTIIVAMSGQFVQRGELAIFDKWTRAKKAIENEIDLVIEIPPYYVLNNANIFAKKAIEILYDFGVRKIYFGTKDLTIDEMTIIAKKILKNSNEIEVLKREHHSLPRALNFFLNKKISSNDLLGICYILEAEKLNLKIKFIRVRRIIDDKNYTSASKIRKDIFINKNNNYSLINSKENSIQNLNNYSDIIIGKLLTTKTKLNVINYLKNKIIEIAPSDFNELVDKSHNKNFTKSNLRRESIKFVLELEEKLNFEPIILASNIKGNAILKLIKKKYAFGHTRNNINNLKIENFISLKLNNKIDFELAKKTIKFEKKSYTQD